MGLFEKKLKAGNQSPRAAADDFDGPVEEVRLTSVPAAAARASEKQADQPPADAGDYGIDKAIELMRKLPGENVELVVRVVKTTLESMQISVSAIVRDAKSKEARLGGRVDTLRKEIAELESEI